jgi:hypothetical protein
MTTSDDRYTHPPDGEDPRRYDDLEAHAADAAGRQTSHDQQPDRQQGLSSDKQGRDPSGR